MAKIYILHENNEWVVPLRAQLEQRELPYDEWFLHEGTLDLSEAPPPGVFYNRMSASSHTRGHRYAPEYTGAVLAWLELARRPVFNGSRALQLEVSKVAQYASLRNFGVETPHTIAAVGREKVLDAARTYMEAHGDRPFITKHNRAGKGLGVQLFRSFEALEAYVTGDDFEPSIDGITLIQAYIEAPEPYITRMEFIGGTFLYAVRVDTSEGFELCPADVCQIGDDFCPTNVETAPKFQIIQDFTHPLIEKCERFLAANKIHMAGIEFIVDANGHPYVYDVNTNTNYNPDAEAAAAVNAMGVMADFLGDALKKL